VLSVFIFSSLFHLTNSQGKRQFDCIMSDRDIVSDYLLSKLSDTEINGIAKDLKSPDCRLNGDMVIRDEGIHIVAIHLSGSSGVPKTPNSPYIPQF